MITTVKFTRVVLWQKITFTATNKIMRNSDKINVSTFFALMYKRMSFFNGPVQVFFVSVGYTKFPFVSGIHNFQLFLYIYNICLVWLLTWRAQVKSSPVSSSLCLVKKFEPVTYLLVGMQKH
jgi:hypothetical protein